MQRNTNLKPGFSRGLHCHLQAGCLTAVFGVLLVNGDICECHRLADRLCTGPRGSVAVKIGLWIPF